MTRLDGTRYQSCFCGRLHMLVPVTTLQSCGKPECHPPRRIRMSRAKGWRMPPRTIYVGRPTRWGNPFVVGAPITTGFDGYRAGYYRIGHEVGYDQTLPTGLVASQAVAFYRSELLGALAPDPDDDPRFETERLDLVAALARLAGHDLACWCPLDMPCHADVLLELANPDRPRR